MNPPSGREGISLFIRCFQSGFLKNTCFMTDGISVCLPCRNRRYTVCCEIHGRGTVSREDVTVRESIPGLYVLPVYLFAGDLMEYRFYDSADRTLKSGTERLTPSEIVQRPVSRYHVLNQALEETVTQTEKLKKYAEMMDMTADTVPAVVEVANGKGRTPFLDRIFMPPASAAEWSKVYEKHRSGEKKVIYRN